MRLAEVDVVLLDVHLSGPQHDEETMTIALQLRALMGQMGVLDRQVVERELLLDLPEELFIRLVQADPDEAFLMLEGVLDVLDVDVDRPAPLGVHRAIHDAWHHRSHSRAALADVQ